jgi:hypothetical protein
VFHHAQLAFGNEAFVEVTDPARGLFGVNLRVVGMYFAELIYKLFNTQ